MNLHESKSNFQSNIGNILLTIGSISGIGISIITGFIVAIIVMFAGDNPNTPSSTLYLQMILILAGWIAVVIFFIGICGRYTWILRKKHAWISYLLALFSTGIFFALLYVGYNNIGS